MEQGSTPNSIPVAEPLIGAKELEYVTDCLKSGWISSLGKYVGRFEKEFAAFCGVEHGVATFNGTTALHLALAALDIGPGDEVIVPTLSFVATANVVKYTGAEPVFVDSEPYTWNIDPRLVEACITPRTKAIIAVHIYGHPADMDALRAIADKHSLRLIEDAAEAHGAKYKGKRTGSLGDIAAFSFYGNKIMTTGEGGILVTDHQELAERAAFLKDHAMSPKTRYWHPEIGFNYRMTNIQAAIGVAQLENIEALIDIRLRNAHRYQQGLAGVPGITLAPQAPWAENVYWMYSILIEDDFPVDRDEMMLLLKEQGIDSRPFFHPMHTFPPYARGLSLPVAEELSIKGINLPSGSTLTAAQVDMVCDAIREIAGLKRDR